MKRFTLIKVSNLFQQMRVKEESGIKMVAWEDNPGEKYPYIRVVLDFSWYVREYEFPTYGFLVSISAFIYN